MSAIQALAGSNDASALPALADTTRKDSDARIRAAAAMALGGRGERTAIPPLVQAAGDNDPWVRVNAIEALAQIGGDEVIPYVRKAQSDADADVANAAVMALRELPGAERGDTAP
jgi:HEAT repeat protein